MARDARMVAVDVRIDATTFRELRQQMFGFDRELLGKLNSRLKRAVDPVRKDAENRAATLGLITSRDGRPSGIATAYNRGRKDVTVKIGGRTSNSGNDAIARLQIRGKAPALAEFAANANTPQGEALVRRLSRLGSPGRFAWEAVDKNEGRINDEIRAEVEKTAAEFSARLASGLSGGVVR